MLCEEGLGVPSKAREVSAKGIFVSSRRTSGWTGPRTRLESSAGTIAPVHKVQWMPRPIAGPNGFRVKINIGGLRPPLALPTPFGGGRGGVGELI